MKKNNSKKIAIERINKLFELAKTEKNGRAKRYVYLARRISEKTKTRIPKEFKRKFCRKCNSFFRTENLRVRNAKKKKYVTYSCLACGNIQRYPFIKERLVKKSK